MAARGSPLGVISGAGWFVCGLVVKSSVKLTLRCLRPNGSPGLISNLID